MYKIILDKEAEDYLNKLDNFVARRIISKIRGLKENPFSKDIKRLKNQNLFRLRVGDYRVLFEINKDLITIFKIGHRKNIYEDF